MNINQLIQGIVGSTHTTGTKALELKVGEIVKGVVLQLLADQEALVNIGGTPVRARLETPLQAGMMTLLQVQPESSHGQVVLKPLSSSNVQIHETSLPELMRSLNLKDTESNRTLLQQLHAAAIPLNAKNIKAFQQIGNMVPAANIPQEQWTEASIVAFKKGLPLKSEVVLPLQQAMFGKPLQQSLEQLQSSLQRYVQSASGQAENSDTMLLVRKLVDTLNGLTTGRPLLSHTGSFEQGARTVERPILTTTQVHTTASTQPLPATSNNQTQTIAASASGIVPSTTVPSAQSAQIPVQTQTATVPNATNQANPVPTTTSNASPTLTTPINTASTNGPVTIPLTTGAIVADQPASSSTIVRESQSVEHQVRTTVPIEQLSAQQLSAAPNEPDDSPWIKQLLKQLGVDYEHRTAHVLTQSMESIDAEQLQFRHESVKGLLLQLSSLEQLPNQLKESTQQILQQITGQQLLLGGERGSPFSLVTLFVPIQHQNGTDTASVHIQSKRSQGGNLDANNCRLLFDLRMSTLGDTLIDVQVVDRIVSLQVHNDYPMIGNLLETLKPEIESAMNEIGFQFISLKHAPYPDPTVGQSGEVTSLIDNRSVMASNYHSKPYKGVDYRI